MIIDGILPLSSWIFPAMLEKLLRAWGESHGRYPPIWIYLAGSMMSGGMVDISPNIRYKRYITKLVDILRIHTYPTY
jgi:hypothetical protein